MLNRMFLLAALAGYWSNNFELVAALPVVISDERASPEILMFGLGSRDCSGVPIVICKHIEQVSI